MTESAVIQKRFRWSYLRHGVQGAVFLLFVCAPLVAGWALLGLTTGGDDAISTPAELPFYGTLSSSSVGGFTLLDPFAVLEILVASKTFYLDWLWFALPILIGYGLIRGRVFCGWVCPVNLLLEITDGLRSRLGVSVKEHVIPRHTKLFVALGVLILSALLSVPVFEIFSPISAINKGIVLGSTTGLVLLVAIIVVEFFWAHRLWCRAICPVGGFYEAIGRVGLVSVAIDHDACIHCDACKRTCICDPEILVPAVDGTAGRLKAGDCMVCGRCVDSCPTNALCFKPGYREGEQG